MRLLDRYVLQNFAIPFLYCTFGFLAIWLVFDLSDNGREFIEANVKMKDLALYYVSQFPSVLVISLPVALLLALLYSLSRMSRSNEIISMLTAGCSVVRVIVPLFLFGILITGVSFWLNYSLGPHSEEMKKVLMDKITKGRDRSQELDQQLFRNRADNRTWYAEEVQKKMDTLKGVQIIQQDKDGDITTKYYANWAYFHPAKASWTLMHGKQVNFDKLGNILNEDDTWLRGTKELVGWSETMWRIISSNLPPESLSLPELEDYLRFNADFPEVQLAPYRTHFWYRWSVPMQCLVVILIAAPLGIVFNRRGVLAGVATCIFLFAVMGLVDKFFLALGKGDRISAPVAAWGPDAIFAAIGLFLLYMRSTNRDLPTLRLPKFRMPWAR